MKKIFILLFLTETSLFALGKKDVQELQNLLVPKTNIESHTISPSSQIENLDRMKSDNIFRIISNKINHLIEREKIPSHLKYLNTLKTALQESVEKNNLIPLRNAIETVLSSLE